MCTASDMRIYNVDIKLKTRYNMLKTSKAEYRLLIFFILRGCSSMAERRLPKPITWVRFPSPAPFFVSDKCNVVKVTTQFRRQTNIHAPSHPAVPLRIQRYWVDCIIVKICDTQKNICTCKMNNFYLVTTVAV